MDNHTTLGAEISHEVNQTPSSPLSQGKSSSRKPSDAQTADEFLTSQLQLEADAREALPYKFDHCTRPLGKLRQSLFSCLTCNPPPANPDDPYNAAGVCYSCSIECHGNHNLVELFCKRNFECDCGTTRLPTSSPCTLRLNPATNRKGGVHSEQPADSNQYCQNFQNRFCSCKGLYNPETQKGIMFQCLGLGTAKTGGCGEDWWHPGCILGLKPDWYENNVPLDSNKDVEELASGSPRNSEDDDNGDEVPLPSGFPAEEDFEGFICYKCVDAYPWIKRYAGTQGFLPAVVRQSALLAADPETLSPTQDITPPPSLCLKRPPDETDDLAVETSPKRVKIEKSASRSTTAATADSQDATPSLVTASTPKKCRYVDLPPSHPDQISLFFREDFRAHLCRCDSCFPLLQHHPQLLELEDTYEPSISSCHEQTPGSTAGSSSLYDRGESALQNIDRVRAIEGIMAFNNLKDKLKPFFQQFAESGEPISAEDIKAYFAKIRGDELAIKEAGDAAIGSEESGV